ncbi:MAG: acyl transferase [Bacteroidetes bacterium]|nr:acyl transferase [Bacteroidota bacterium]
MKDWRQIFEIENNDQFEEWALRVFHFQVKNTLVYREFCEKIGRIHIQSFDEIPFLPISFFKTHAVKHNDLVTKLTFKSSGTTGAQRSQHPVVHPELYEYSFLKTYRDQIGAPENQVILALLPNYIEQGESSLVYMVDRLVKETKNLESGFLLDSIEKVEERYKNALKSGKKVVIFGVSYALLDLAEMGMDLSQAIILETGGMKGRRKEMTKKELHQQLKHGLNVQHVASEYGMTELFSQAYALSDGLFTLPNWMQIKLREVNDPFSDLMKNKTGGIQVIDLANVFSCSFIDTQDLGRIQNGKLELMGRYDLADTRGCNLMIQ